MVPPYLALLGDYAAEQAGVLTSCIELPFAALLRGERWRKSVETVSFFFSSPDIRTA